MKIFNFLNREKFSTKIGLAYALIASVLAGISSHIVNSEDGIDVGAIGFAEVLGGASVPIIIGVVIGSIRSSTKADFTEGTIVKQSIFYTAVIMVFLILFPTMESKLSDGFSNSEDDILEDLSSNTYKFWICEKNCEAYSNKTEELFQQAKMKGIENERILSAMELGQMRAMRVLEKRREDSN